jgi:hypothetical protein
MKKSLTSIFAILFFISFCVNVISASEARAFRQDFSFEHKSAADSVQQKANINTSRSNIKQPRKSAGIGVNEPGVNRKDLKKNEKNAPAAPINQKDKTEGRKK